MFYLLQNTQIKASYISLDAPVNGFKVVRIPTIIKIDEEDPSPAAFNADSLVNQKFAELLAGDPSFSFVVFDEIGYEEPDVNENPASQAPFDLASAQNAGTGTGKYWIEGDGTNDGVLDTTVMDVSADGAFDRFKVYWDIYSLTRTQSGERVVLDYEPEIPDLVNVSISTNGGASFEPVTHLEPVVTVAPGANLQLRFENTSTNRYYIGSFAILY